MCIECACQQVQALNLRLATSDLFHSQPAGGLLFSPAHVYLPGLLLCTAAIACRVANCTEDMPSAVEELHLCPRSNQCEQ